MRLDKYLADMLPYSRREIKEVIRRGRVTVNDTIITDPGCPAGEDDCVCLDGQPIAYRQYEYYILNKPCGYLCTNDYSPNVLELIDTARKDVMPVGRLDKDTEGLLLLTDDGQLAHYLLAPQHHVDKIYYVETDVPIPESAVGTFAAPMEFQEFTSEPALLQITGEKMALLTIHEGKFHQVKRMFHHIGCEVTYLKRIRFGPLELGDLSSGSYRSLTEEEIKLLKEK